MRHFGIKKCDLNLDGIIDLHSHILPGIDDGASDFDASIKLIKELVSSGVTDIFATPHYVDETVYVSPKINNVSLLEQLRERISVEGINVKLHLGNEIYISRELLNLLNDGIISTLMDSQYLLVELPMDGDFPGYRDILLELIRAGYHVVLAHPERYSSFQKDFSLIVDLHNMGVLFQCNFGSIVGQYGKSAKKTLINMLKQNMVFGFGSDIHHPRGEFFVRNAVNELSKYCSKQKIEEMLILNPQKILG